jgi:hypothetical protein
MKPKPNLTVREILEQDSRIPAKAILPYDTYEQDKAGFLTLSVQGEFVAIPLLALGRATLSNEATSIILEFGQLMAKIEGRKLDELFEDILLCKVRVIRVGRHPMCTIERIQINDEALIQSRASALG